MFALIFHVMTCVECIWRDDSEELYG